MELRTAKIFIDTVDDLRKRSVLRASEYDAVQAAGLMRRLFLDRQKLMHLANSQARTTLTFEWFPTAFLAAGRFVVATPTVDEVLGRARLADRDTGPGLRSGTVDDLIAWPVLRYGGEKEAVSAGGLISYFANRMGGVHYEGKPRRTDEPVLTDAIEAIPEQLRAVVISLGRVVVAGLERLSATLYYRHFIAVE